MMKKSLAVICIAGLFVSLHAVPNARYYALGQACFVGDILVSTAQPWQILGYADQIQGTADVTSNQQPGPAVLIKSLGENAAIGLAANMFDKRTKGQVFNSPYYQRSTQFAGLLNPDQKMFPNYPQLNFAIKLFGQKFGLSAFYQTETFNNSRFTPLVGQAYLRSELNGSVSDYGGCFSARFGFGNLGWNPWIRVGVPLLDGKETSSSSDSAGVPSTPEIIQSKLVSSGSSNLMYNFGSCFDYTFGDLGWGIIGAWYRNEQYKFEKTSSASPGTATLSPKYDNDYYDYFISFTPHIFGDLLIGFEYQGAYYTTKNMYEDLPKNDTTDRRWYNEFIIAMEKPIKVNKPWLDKFTFRGSMAYSIGIAMEKTEIAIIGSPQLIDVTERWTPVQTINYDNRDGLLMYLGFGLTKGRCTIDLCTDVFNWYKQGGMAMGPPPTYMTLTVDLH